MTKQISPHFINRTLTKQAERGTIIMNPDLESKHWYPSSHMVTCEQGRNWLQQASSLSAQQTGLHSNADVAASRALHRSHRL